MKEFSVVLTQFEGKVNTVRYSALAEVDGKTIKAGGLISDLYISWDAFDGKPPDKIIVTVREAQAEGIQ